MYTLVRDVPGSWTYVPPGVDTPQADRPWLLLRPSAGIGRVLLHACTHNTLQGTHLSQLLPALVQANSNKGDVCVCQVLNLS